MNEYINKINELYKSLEELSKKTDYKPEESLEMGRKISAIETEVGKNLEQLTEEERVIVRDKLTIFNSAFNKIEIYFARKSILNQDYLK